MLLNHPDLDVNVQDKVEHSSTEFPINLYQPVITTFLCVPPLKRYSDTALMWACYKGHTRIVKLLLAHYSIKINLQRKVSINLRRKYLSITKLNLLITTLIVRNHGSHSGVWRRLHRDSADAAGASRCGCQFAAASKPILLSDLWPNTLKCSSFSSSLFYSTGR